MRNLLNAKVWLGLGLAVMLAPAGYGACTYSITPTNRSHLYVAATNTVTVNAATGCAWTAVSSNSWLAIQSGASGSATGLVTYTVAANTNVIGRTGLVTIAGQTFTVAQDGAPCAYSLAPASRSHGSGAETGLVSVTTSSGCAWNVTHTNSWITFTSGTNGSGNGNTGYAITANPAGLARSGNVVIAGQSFTVSQAAATCTFALATNSVTYSAAAATDSVALTTLAGCTWSVVNTNSWLTLLSAANSTNSGAVNYSVQSNTTALARSGVVTIAGLSYTVTQSGAACSFTISSNGAAHGPGAGTNSVAVTTLIGCAWSVVNTNPWVTILSAANNTNSGTATYSVQANGTALARSGVVVVAGQNFTVTQSGAACSFTISSNGAAHGPGAETNSVAVTTLVGCPWSVVNTNPWVTILSAANSTNSGTATYSVQANGTALARSGVVVMAGQNFTITQSGAACSFTLDAASAAFGPGAASGSVAVTTLTGCAWSVANPNSWVTILPATSQTNSGSVSLSVPANPTALARTGSVTIAGQSFTVTQAGAACTFTLGTNSAAHGTGAETNSVTVTTLNACAWSVSTTNSWITILSAANSTNSGTATYGVLTNQTGLARTGLVSIAGQNFTVTQAGAPCAYSTSPASRSHGYGATTNTVGVSAGMGCAWTAVSTNGWLTILSGSSGNAAGVVTYAVAANANSIFRTGLVTIAGQWFTVVQDGAPCNFMLTPTTRNHGSGGTPTATPIVVSATTNCAWSVVNTSAWINLTGPTSGVGNGSVPYGVLANPTPVKRTGNVLIADQLFLMTQSPAACLYEFMPTNRLHGYAGSTGLVTVSTIPASGGCQWFVDNTNSWITITANPTGTNTGTMGYTVGANPNSTPRTGTFGVWDQTYFTVFQNAAPCSYSILPTSSTPGAEPETNVVTITAIGGCNWGVTNTNSWISFLGATTGTGNGSVTWATAANASFTGRTGVVSIAGQNFTVRQDATSCSFKLSPTNRVHGYSATSNSVSVTVASICSWTVVNTNPWVTIPAPASGTGNGTITYLLSQNNAAGDRTGVVLIGGQPFSLTQHGVGCAIAVSPMTRNHGHGAASNILTVTTGAGCTWAVLNTNAWISIVGSTNGVGSNIVSYLVPANPSSLPRSGYITIEEDVVMISQSGSPCTYDLTPSTYSHSPVQETGTVSVASFIGCNWTVSNTNSWISILSGTNGTGSAGVTYSVTANLNSASRTGLVTIASQPYTVLQDGVTCSYRIAPTNRTHGYAATTNTMTLTVSNPCPWSVVNTNPWLTILSSPTGVGTATITYSVSANGLSPEDRVGTVVVGGQASVITQHGFPCLYSVTPTTRTHGNGAASNSFSVTTSNGCPWVVGNTNPWISIVSGATGNANGTVGYTVDANAAPADRLGVLTVDGQTFTITQHAASCSFTISPSLRNHGYGAATNTITATASAGCNWAVVNTNGWVTILSGANGSGTGAVAYAVAANPGAAARSGVVVIGDQAFAVTQAGSAASFAFESISMGATGEVTLTLVGGPNGVWELQSSPNLSVWTTLANVTNTTGRVVYTAAATGGGKRFYRATLNASLCTFALSPGSRSHGYGAASNSVDVTTGTNCAWQVVNTNAWITILSALSGTNSGTVNYTVAANTNFTARSGTVVIGDQSFVVNQAAYLCNVKLSPANRTHGFGANTNSANINAGIGCAWALVNTNDWITITSPTSGVGSNSFTYTISANFGSTPRVGVITLDDQSLTLTQSGATNGFAFESAALNTGGGLTVRLAGAPAGIWELQSSSNLVDWVKVADLTNTTGRVEYIAPSTSVARRFFRAVLP